MDTHIHDILTFLPAEAVARLAECSWIMMVLARSDIRIWKDLVCADLYPSFNIKWSSEYWRTYARTKGCSYSGIDHVAAGAKRRPVYSDVIYRSYLCYHCMPPPLPGREDLERVDVDEMGYEGFVERERRNWPFIIKGLGEVEFSSLGTWSKTGGLEGKAGGRKFRCTSVQSSHAVSTTIGDYTEYAKEVKEESPMYLFERNMGELEKGYGEGLKR